MIRTHLRKPLTYLKREVDELVTYEGKAIATLFSRNREWSCVVQGDIQFGAPTLVEGFNSKRAAVEYALRAHGKFDNEPPHSLLTLSNRQRLKLERSRGIAEVSELLKSLNAAPRLITQVNQMSDRLADEVKSELDANTVKMFENRPDVDPTKFFTNIKYLRSTKA